MGSISAFWDEWCDCRWIHMQSLVEIERHQQSGAGIRKCLLFAISWIIDTDNGDIDSMSLNNLIPIRTPIDDLSPS
jgi:hypothetical protein